MDFVAAWKSVESVLKLVSNCTAKKFYACLGVIYIAMYGKENFPKFLFSMKTVSTETQKSHWANQLNHHFHSLPKESNATKLMNTQR